MSSSTSSTSIHVPVSLYLTWSRYTPTHTHTGTPKHLRNVCKTEIPCQVKPQTCNSLSWRFQILTSKSECHPSIGFCKLVLRTSPWQLTKVALESPGLIKAELRPVVRGTIEQLLRCSQRFKHFDSALTDRHWALTDLAWSPNNILYIYYIYILFIYIIYIYIVYIYYLYIHIYLSSGNVHKTQLQTTCRPHRRLVT